MRAIEALLDKGVNIPNPLSLDIGAEVDVDRISADGVTIHPGCRIRGGRTVISAGVTLSMVGMGIGGWVSCCQVADSGRVIEADLQGT